MVTSNQAVIWDALRLIGWRMPPRHLGRLFAVSSADEPVHVTPAG
jgi:maleate cis-trans isomerase